MSLARGARLGPYEILALIGAGGMGEVYRARDTRLGRTVALKILAPELSVEPEHRRRIEREARTISRLNHAHICTLYDIGRQDGLDYLVMELLDGETIAQRVARGPLPIGDVLRAGMEIAGALEAAHRGGIIHRDLKPANVMMTSDGAKLMDFGLARSASRDASTGSASEAPTRSLPVTGRNVVLGTAPYMSPEQARGQPLDRRTDIWSFGCVLFEMITGRRAFPGETGTDITAAILEREPDWERLPPEVPADLRGLLQRCLSKDRERRLRDIGDAWLALIDYTASPGPEAQVQPPPKPRARRWTWGLLAAVVLAGSGYLAGRMTTGRAGAASAAEARHFSVVLPAGDRLLVDDTQPVAISPDGRRIVYQARRGQTEQLFLRDLRLTEPVPLRGTEQGRSPFFSPDSDWVAFFAGERLKKLSLGDGRLITLCDAPGAENGSWGDAGSIVFSSPVSPSGLMITPEQGGRAEPVRVARAGTETGRLWWPSFLPGGKAVLCVLWTGMAYEQASLVVVSLPEGGIEVFGEAHSRPVFVPTGHVIHSLGHALVALPFDLGRRTPVGKPFPVFEFGGDETLQGYNISKEGTLAYVVEPRERDAIAGMTDGAPVWVDRTGNLQPLGAPVRHYTFPNISPNGERIALTVFGESNVENWIYERERGIMTRLTFEGNEHLAIWAPDGRTLAFAHADEGSPNIYLMASDGSGQRQRLTVSDHHQCPSSWSPDGRYLVFGDARADADQDIWMIDLKGDRQAHPLVQTRFEENQGMISPDGMAMVFTSNRTGQREIWARPFPEDGPTVQVSTKSGYQPMWSPDGEEVFYLSGGQDGRRDPAHTLMSARLLDRHALRFGPPRALFSGRFKSHEGARANYDVAPDGQRFLMLVAGGEARQQGTIEIETNWFSRLSGR